MFVALLLGSTLLASAIPAGAAVQPAGLDHFLCYNASSPPGSAGFPLTPQRAKLKNQFGSFRARVSPFPNLHCNPVEKTVIPDDGTEPIITPIRRPKAHLLCYPISTREQPNRIVVARNQFGKAKLRIGQPDSLCLPTWKNPTAPPPTLQPRGLDHFVCYPAEYLDPAASAFKPPTQIALKDQFAAEPVPVQVGPPGRLCVPTAKTVGDPAVTYGVTHPNAHLVCFQVTPTPHPASVIDQNQFGTDQVLIGETRGLCLPSFKKLLGDVVPT
jgi:hypothetical protein